ncbi:hypothetical protein AERO_03265 [Aeromicrobium fastidiosum]|uniref:hypothetical protein n=1 Tax=Aeromicrobium fastidiosum TaxID=52699 RepID=UPI0020236025|nr:hypothetical protein [Aeromicrobium fastidiosum]MCL8250391.1 hypothetical protein [Aeromicrobium fastidiosum]
MSVVPRRSGAELAKNDAIGEAIVRAVEKAHFGDILAARGITTVALDEDGRMIEYRPDGGTTVLS